MAKQKIDWRIMVAGLTALTIIEVCALFNGIDGVLLTTIVGIIALTLGIVIPSPIKAK